MSKRGADEAGLDTSTNPRPSTAPRVSEDMPPPPLSGLSAAISRWTHITEALGEATVRSLLAITLANHSHGVDRTLTACRSTGPGIRGSQTSKMIESDMIESKGVENRVVESNTDLDFSCHIEDVENVYKRYSNNYSDTPEFGDSFKAVGGIESIVVAIVKQASTSNASVATKRSALETLCEIARIVIEGDGDYGDLGREIRTEIGSCDTGSCIDEGMETIFSGMSKPERNECVWWQGKMDGWELVEDITYLAQDATDFDIMENLATVLKMMNEFADDDPFDNDSNEDNDEDADEEEAQEE